MDVVDVDGSLDKYCFGSFHNGIRVAADAARGLIAQAKTEEEFGALIDLGEDLLRAGGVK